MEKEQLVYTVKELQDVMKMGRNRTLALVRRKGFPAIRNGRTWLIPKEPLKRWLEEQAMKGGQDDHT